MASGAEISMTLRPVRTAVRARVEANRIEEPAHRDR